jgi:hypothetical protein
MAFFSSGEESVWTIHETLRKQRDQTQRRDEERGLQRDGRAPVRLAPAGRP